MILHISWLDQLQQWRLITRDKQVMYFDTLQEALKYE